MELILDEWVVREVIDTLYMVRTTLLGITGLDSPQEVAKKSANETAITRRISKAIDIIQQSEQPHLPSDLEEAAMNYIAPIENEDGLKVINFSGQDIKDAFIAGAKWQAEQDKETIELAEDHAYLAGAVNEREKIMKEAVEGWVAIDKRNNCNLYRMKPKRARSRALFWTTEDCCSLPISASMFPKLKWDDDPKKVKFIIVKED